MRADGDAAFARQADRAPHHRRVTRVKAAGDIRGCNASHHVLVGSHLPGAERFAEVAVQVDPHQLHRQHGSDRDDSLEKRSEPQVLVLLVLVVVEIHDRHQHGGKVERVDEWRDGHRSAERPNLDRRLAVHAREGCDERANLRVAWRFTKGIRPVATLGKPRDLRVLRANLGVGIVVDEHVVLPLDVRADLRASPQRVFP